MQLVFNTYQCKFPLYSKICSRGDILNWATKEIVPLHFFSFLKKEKSKLKAKIYLYQNRQK